MSVLRVTEPFSADVDGVPRIYKTGDLVQSDDKVVTKSRARFFEDAEEFIARTVTRSGRTETATAAPGEVRHLGAKPTAPPAPPVVPAVPPVKKED